MDLPHDCKIIIPTAPKRLVTDIEKNTYSWFNIESFHLPEDEEELNTDYFSKIFAQNELKQSVIDVLTIVEREANALGSGEKVYLGGF